MLSVLSVTALVLGNTYFVKIQTGLISRREAFKINAKLLGENTLY